MVDDRPLVTVLGGYGSIGRLVTEHLARTGVCRLAVAGRDPGKATVLAGEIGDGAAALAIDVENAPVETRPLGRVVVNATGPSWRTSLPAARLAVAAGADFVDLGGYDLLHDGLDASVAGSSRVIVSAGWMPGLSEILCRRVVEAGRSRLDILDRVDVFCGARDRWSLSSAGDMVWHLLERSGSGWYQDGIWKSAAPWRALRRVNLDDAGRQWLLAVPNPQAVKLSSELGTTRLATWLGLIGRRTFFAILRARVIGRRDPEQAAAGIAEAIAAEAGTTPIGFCEVHVSGPRGCCRGRITTHDNLRLTAIAAAESALCLLDEKRRPPPGVRYMGDSFSPSDFLARMAHAGIHHEFRAA